MFDDRRLSQGLLSGNRDNATNKNMEIWGIFAKALV